MEFFVPKIDQPFTVRRTEIHPDDTPDLYLQKLARITLDEMFQLVGVLTPEGILLECNRAALVAGGLIRDEVIGKPFWETYWWTCSPKTQEDLRDAIARAAQGEFVRYDTEVYGRKGGTETMIMDFTLLPVRDDTGHVVFLLPEGRDITEKKAYEREIARQREELAQLDVLKTQFFANVSHEFRTPLTLMLGPLEDVLANAHGVLPLGAARELDVSHRNALRLLKLVNTMLDFSRLEAGRMQASYQPTDLAALTAELASNFRSACDKAGLRLVVECPPLPTSEQVYVDHDMWEKIVLNLVSNAFKFTLAGHIDVRLEAADGQARLTVRDTGVGIPGDALPHMFERFHRVEGSRGRTHEGTGIGLALVQELVKLHGGTVRVDSVLGEGSTFTVTLPFGKAHLDPQRIGKAPELASTAIASSAFVEEALRWLPDDGSEPSGEPAFALALARAGHDRGGEQPAGQRARILWADDNADMRDYVSRLLGGRFDVQAVADGQAALEAARANPPDLVLSDVMMPRLDGFGLLRALRADPHLREVPIILLSARAGEESRIEGMEAGADDYLIKPFSARELVARVETHVKMSRLRREADAARRESERRLSTLIASLPGMAYRCRNDRQWTMEFVSEGVTNITGYTPDDLTSGRTRWAQLQHPDDVEWTWEARQSAAREHRPFQFEYRIRHKDGSERRVWEQGQGVYNGTDEPVAFEGFITDVTERKRTEAASATLAAIVESSDDAIISKDLDGVITSWNKSAERIFGYTASEAVGQPITILIPPDRLDEEPKILERLRRGERVDHFETIRMRKDGSRLDISLTISPVKDADGRIVGASKVARDITERKQVEAALRTREQELADFFDNAALGLHWVGPDGIILRVNQAELNLLGYTRDEYVGHHIAEFHADQHVIEDILRRLHAGEELHDYEARLVCKDGTIKHVLIDANVLWEQGQFIHTRCFTRDITAQKQAEELLLQAHATLEQRVAERTALLALIQDVTRAANEAPTSAAALQYALDRLCAYTGWPVGHAYLAVAPGAERWVPTPLWHLDDPARFTAFQQATQALEVGAGEDLIGRVGARGQPEWRSDVATDPTFHRWHAARAAGLSTGVAWPVLVGSEAAGVLEFYTTEVLAPNPTLLEAMTQIGTQLGRAIERERAAAQVQRQQEALLQQEKLAAMSTMLASVAHELNNPLATILLQAELVRDDVRGGPLAEPVTEIAQAAVRCERLVRQFLTLARQHPPEHAVVALNPLVAETVELLVYPLRVDNVTVHLHLDAQVPPLWGDAHQLQQVLINLLTNAQQALRAAPGAREVALTTQYDPTQQQITLLVADTGPGIPPALQARIFEPFFTTKPLGVGTGLGLPLCRGIIEAHGGTLEVSSAPGQGATFRLTLPVGAVPASLPTPPPVDEAPARRGGTILVVDDEPSLARGLARLLERDGHTVDLAADGRQALARLEARAYDCILCDVRMPELDGPSLYRLLERQQPHLCPRLIFLTGDTLEPATHAFLAQSGAPCLTKPFPIAEARRAIWRILGGV